MAHTSPLLEHFIVGPLQMRCTVITDSASGDTIIIDGGDEPQRIISWIDHQEGRGPDWSLGEFEGERKVVALVNTHAHFDHSGHVPTLKQHYEVDWYLHSDDDFLQTLASKSAQRWGFSVPEPAIADEKLLAGEAMTFGSIELEILHTPGHTLGGCCLLFKVEDGPDHVIVGDTIFAGSVGRTDLPHSGGDFDLLANSIHTQLWPLDGDTVIHPGHGPLSTIAHEKQTNPFVGDSAGSGMFSRGRYA